MRKVAHSVVELIVTGADRCDVPLQELARGLPIDVAQLRRLVGGLDWDLFVELVDRLVERVGFDRVEALCAHVPDIAPGSQRMLSNFVSARTLLRFVCKLMGPNQYPMFVCGYEERTNSAGEAIGHVTMRLRPGFRDGHNVFRLKKAALSSVPCFLGLPPTRVDASTTPRGGDYDILLPASQTLLARARRHRATSNWAETLRQLEEDNARLRQATEQLWRARDNAFHVKLSEAEAKWGLTPRQVQVVSGLARGLSNKELGQELGCSVKTVETHITDVLRRAALPTRLALVATFWKDLWRRRASTRGRPERRWLSSPRDGYEVIHRPDAVPQARGRPNRFSEPRLRARHRFE
ncbi:MAG: LuxR C-terminal-related transcriptional regulator [Myxococcota bacterium]